MMGTGKTREIKKKFDGEDSISDGPCGHLEVWQKAIPQEINSMNKSVEAMKCGIRVDNSLSWSLLWGVGRRPWELVSLSLGSASIESILRLGIDRASH